MCIAIFKPQGKKIPKDLYHTCFANNNDGAGFAFIHDEKLITAKGFFTFDEFWENFEPFEEKAGLIHFRVGTSGGSNGENCHPWRVSDRLVFVHNGTLSIDRKNQSISDTGNFAELILKPMTEEFPDWWKQKELKWMLENSIGPNNKIILFNADAEHLILNEKAGEWKDDCWFSNNSFSFSKRNYSCGTSYSAPVSPAKPVSITPTGGIFNSNREAQLIDQLDEFADIDVASLDLRLELAEKERIKSLS